MKKENPYGFTDAYCNYPVKLVEGSACIWFWFIPWINISAAIIRNVKSTNKKMSYVIIFFKCIYWLYSLSQINSLAMKKWTGDNEV